MGSAIITLGLAPRRSEYQNYSLKPVGVFSKNREEWVLLDIACVLYGLTLVPLYDTLGLETIAYVIGHANLATVFCSMASLDILLNKTE